MKKIVVVALIAGVALTAPLFAGDGKVRVKIVELGTGEGSEHEKIELNIDEDGDASVFEADDLAVGESRQFFSNSGKEVVLTRTEEGVEIEVDGKKIDIGGGLHAKSGGHHCAHHSGHQDGDGGCVRKKVVIRKMGDDDEQGLHQVDDHDVIVIRGPGGEGHGDHHVMMIDGSDMELAGEHGEAAVYMTIERDDAAQRLIESGVLDEVDADIRKRILDVLEEGDHAKIIRERIVEVEKENR